MRLTFRLQLQWDVRHAHFICSFASIRAKVFLSSIGNDELANVLSFSL